MEERPFTERFKELAFELQEQEQKLKLLRPSFQKHAMLRLTWLCAEEIESLRQEINELKQQLKNIQK